MPMNPSSLASDIQDALQSKMPTAQITGMAAAIVAHVMTGVVSFLPGTVMGTAPPTGGPLAAGAASGGVILLVPAALGQALVGVFGQPTPQVIGMGVAISTHIMTGMVAFSTGGINGACANTPLTPGPFVGVGANGAISGLSDSAMASMVAAVLGMPTDKIKAMCTKIVNHVQNNAMVTLPLVAGLCSSGGGPLAAGAATGGIIT